LEKFDGAIKNRQSRDMVTLGTRHRTKTRKEKGKTKQNNNNTSKSKPHSWEKTIKL
jgi:hypothetical protein